MLTHQSEQVTLYHAQCQAALEMLPDASVDAVVTDPPYGLSREPDMAEVMRHWLAGDDYNHTGNGFMGKSWDSFVPGPSVWRECFRVLKPGGHLLSFAGSRTQDLMGLAIRLAGFEIRDSIAWLYGSGFPKSLDVSKAIDKTREDGAAWKAVGQWLKAQRVASGHARQTLAPLLTGHKNEDSATANISNWENGLSFPTWERWEELRSLIGFGDQMDAEVWRLNGRKGTPGEAWDQRPITQAEIRPLVPGEHITFDQRSSAERERRDIPVTEAAQQWQGWGTALKPAFEPIVVGRKPIKGTVAANVLEHGTGALNIDGCRIGIEKRVNQAGGQSSINRVSRVEQGYRPTMGDWGPNIPTTVTGRWPTNVVLDESQAAELNGASRFFPVFKYQAKAPTKERPKTEDGKSHPTVKPLELMRWLVKLVTPPGGIVLDPFAGSGTTVEACLLEDFRSVAIEREADYIPLILTRLGRNGIVDDLL